MGEKSCQPEGLQPERPLTLSRGLLIFAISAAPRFALSTAHLENSAATHTCFIVLQALNVDHAAAGGTYAWPRLPRVTVDDFERGRQPAIDAQDLVSALDRSQQRFTG